MVTPSYTVGVTVTITVLWDPVESSKVRSAAKSMSQASSTTVQLPDGMATNGMKLTDSISGLPVA